MISIDRHSKSISISEVREVLGESSDNLFVLCTSDKINKFSRFKPLSNSKKEPLTDAEFEGTTSEKHNKIVFGLNCALLGSEEMNTLHQARWDYVSRPDGSFLSPCRLSDFLGYNSVANSNTYGSIIGTNNTIYYDKNKPIEVQLGYSEDAVNGGIRIQDIISIISGKDVDLSQYYPCIMIGHWVRVLLNDETDTPTTLSRSGRYYVPELPSKLQSEQSDIKVTAFLSERIFQAGLFDYRDWFDVSMGVVTSEAAYTIPELVGLDYSIASEGLAGIAMLDVTGVSYLSTQQAISIIISWRDVAPTQPTYYVFEVVVGWMMASRTVLSQNGMITIPTFPISNFGIMGEMGNEYYVRVSVSGSLDGREYKMITTYRGSVLI